MGLILPARLYPRRNFLLNGDFDFWQRGASFTDLSGYGADMFSIQRAGAMTLNMARASSAPTLAQSGHQTKYSLQVTVGTADTSIATSDYALIYTAIEGYDVKQLVGKLVTLSFWVKSAKTGIHCVSFHDRLSENCYVHEYTINTANTWEKKTVTLHIDNSQGTWSYINLAGLFINWCLAAGSNYHATSGGQWYYGPGSDLATSNQVNVCDAASNVFGLSQVQLELGNVATPFSMLPPNAEFAACQRHYRQSYSHGSNPGGTDTEGRVEVIAYSTQYCPGAHWGVPMRADPTILLYDALGSSGNVRGDTNGNGLAATANWVGPRGFTFITSTDTEFVSGEWVEFHYTARAEL
jgi:hypothetical protein